ncbi:phosphopantetheine-binding protein [Serratia sp. B1]|nr:phosphopantetheine-binding protein [Serratia sp. B1]
MLNVERVGRHDDFFALGGHSLLAVQLANRVQQAGWRLPLSALFAAPVLQALAQWLEREGRRSRRPSCRPHVTTHCRCRLPSSGCGS